MAVCPQCNGSGWIPVDDTSRRKCICAYAKELKAHLGTDIALAPTLAQSPLFVPGGEDLTVEDLFIKIDWATLLPHLQWALTFKTPAFKFCSDVTDVRLLEVYLGKESYGARAKSVRDDVSTYNSLADIVGGQFDLVIIRLGKLGYPNKAMPGILKEALLLREALGKATWLVETPNSIFGPGHFTYSPDLHAYIRERYTVIAIEGEKRHLPPTGIAQPKPKPKKVEPIEDVSLDDMPEAPDPEVQQPEAAFKDPDWDIVSGGGANRRKSGWKPKK